MKKIEEKEANSFSKMFSNMKPSNLDISNWSIPYTYFLSELNQSQLTLIGLLGIEIFLDKDQGYYIKLFSIADQHVVKCINAMKTKPEKVSKVPMWIRKIFKDI